MKHLKTLQIPATTKDVVEFITCDLCGEKIATHIYEVDEVIVNHRYGESYPEAGFGKETNVDLCGQCFEEKLIPWLRSQGVKPNEEYWNVGY